MQSTFEVSSLLHSGYQHEITRTWNSTAVPSASELMFPIFIHEGMGKVPIEALPNQYRYGIDTLISEFTPLVQKGLKSVLIFGVPGEKAEKDCDGSGADSLDSVVIKAIKLFRSEFPSVLVACDVCLCAYTSHGHCGILDGNGNLDNQKSIERLAQVAVTFAKAGCQLIAPSDMMDGRIKAIKLALIANNLGSRVGVMSAAAGSAPSYGDRKCYQLPPGARGLARRAMIRDQGEGADVVMVKPGYPYLDVVRDAREVVPDLPIAVYQVSGEYAMLYHAANNGVFTLKDAVLESMVSAKRAGATILITYFTPFLLDWIKEE